MEQTGDYIVQLWEKGCQSLRDNNALKQICFNALISNFFNALMQLAIFRL